MRISYPKILLGCSVGPTQVPATTLAGRTCASCEISHIRTLQANFHLKLQNKLGSDPRTHRTHFARALARRTCARCEISHIRTLQANFHLKSQNKLGSDPRAQRTHFARAFARHTCARCEISHIRNLQANFRWLVCPSEPPTKRLSCKILCKNNFKLFFYFLK